MQESTMRPVDISKTPGDTHELFTRTARRQSQLHLRGFRFTRHHRIDRHFGYPGLQGDAVTQKRIVRSGRLFL